MERFKARKTYFVFMCILSVFLITGCGGGDGGEWIESVPISPVSSTVPLNGAVGVPIGNKLSVTFSEAMDPATINTTTFTLKQGTTVIAGTVAYAGLTAVFTPASNVAPSTTYTARITAGAENLAGNPLASDYVWTFTTGAAADTTAPTVTFTVPADGDTGVAINKKITATFSEAVDPFTITGTTFTLMQGATAVPGVVTYVGLIATFTPTGGLAANTTYTATITTGAEDLAGNALASDYVWTFTTGAAPDTTAPTVSLTAPADGETGVLTNKKITATFSEAMDPLTISTATFTTLSGATAVSGTVTYSGVTAVFTPATDLAADTSYIVTITTGAEDLAGNALASDYVWTFTTGAAPDTTAPTVTFTDPANGDTGVATNKKIAATFSESMDPLTITTTTFTVTGPGVTPVAGTMVYAGATATFTPKGGLAGTTTYTATITTGAKDLAGNALASDYVWTFTTGAAPDTTAPTVTLTNPVDAATDVILSKKVQATFSEAMDPLTITTATFTLMDGVTPVSGTVAYVGLVATFTPTSDLAAGTTYTATITTGAKDLAGNALASDYVWTFTTVAAVPLGPLPVDLLTAGNFTILTKTGITTTGVTHITGDIGVSPIAATAMTGFGLILDASGEFSTSTLVTGKVYAASYASPTPAILTTAISDMETAYTDAAGRTSPDFTNLGTGNISGMVLAPGLYKFTTGVVINSAGVTFSGGPNDVWIIQAPTLNLQAGAIVTIGDEAQAKNIFWQVPGAVVIAANSTLQGNLLAATAITVASGAVLNGRALGQTNVTLSGNTITAP